LVPKTKEQEQERVAGSITCKKEQERVAEMPSIGLLLSLGLIAHKKGTGKGGRDVFNQPTALPWMDCSQTKDKGTGKGDQDAVDQPTALACKK